MLLERADVSWPEAMGHQAHCQGCGNDYPAEDCLSVAFSRETEGKVQVHMFLACKPCITAKFTEQGRMQ